MQRLKTSLIVPIFNEAPYLPTLFTSIKASTVMPDEILICDNNSTDASLMVIRKIRAGPPVKILHETTQGILPTVERLWKHATGDIILKVDADSVLPPDWIDNTLAHFSADKNLAGCTGPVYSADGSWSTKTITNIGYLLGQGLFRLWKGYFLLYGPNSAFKKSALYTVHGYSGQRKDLDDQIISKKLYDHHLTTSWFSDMGMYHSTRRYHNNPKAYLETILSVFHPKYYTIKS